MICPKCGASVKEGAKFCSKCGASMTAMPPRGKKGGKGFLIVLAILVLAILGGGAVFLAGRRAEPSAGKTPQQKEERSEHVEERGTIDGEAETVETEATETEAQPETAAETAETQAAAEAYDTMYVVNCNEGITLRNAPSVTAAEICQISYGEAVTAGEGTTDGFCQVSYKGNTGYVLAAYLSGEPAEARPASRAMRVVNCKEYITLRTSPSTKAAEIRKIPLGERVFYIEPASNGFYKVAYMGDTGYALASYMEFE